jgi:large subunit ribosomal protein L17
MRHGVKGRKLKRTASHRASTLNGLATSLILHKKIKTTEAKAKEARRFVEPIITRAKRSLALTGTDAGSIAGRVHARREVGRFIKDDAAIKALFEEIAPKVANRAGGYTRVIKLGYRHGDNAEMALLELVDFNQAEIAAAPQAKVAKARPTRNKANTAEAKIAEQEAATAEAPKKPRATRRKKTDSAE